MTSRAPGGWSPYGGPVPDKPPPARPVESKRPPYVLASLVILEFFVIVGLAGWIYWKYQHDKTTQPAGPAPAAGVKSLSHQAVEGYINDHFNLAGVVCNEGANFPMTSNGATFECAGRASQKFIVTVTNKSTGDYTVRSLTPAHTPKHHKPQKTKATKKTKKK